MSKKQCGECGANEGEPHGNGCDFARCQICGNQTSSQLCTHDDLPQPLFFYFPQRCTRCGIEWPDLWMVPDKEWKETIPREHWRDVICWDCFCFIREKRGFPPVNLAIEPYEINALDSAGLIWQKESS